VGRLEEGLPVRPVGVKRQLTVLLLALDDAPGSETDLTCCLYPEAVARTRALLSLARAEGWVKINANGTRWQLTVQGRERAGLTRE